MNTQGMIGALAALTALTGGVCAQAADPAPPAAKKILIAYYSWGGNTRTMAESIQKAVGGDLFEIRPATPYPTGYQACVDQAKKEINEGFMPALAAMPENLAAYDVVFVGSPNWWGTIAPPVRRFLTDSDLKGKTVVPFFTHGGGGVQRCERDTKALCPDSDVRKAGVYSGSRIRTAGESVAQWAKGSL